jgi:hypothetical protein
MNFYSPSIKAPEHHYDFSNDALSYFSQYKDPCAIIAACSSLCLIESIKHYHTKHKRERNQSVFAPISQSCFFISFGLSICAIVISMMQQSSILRKEFDASATSAYKLLQREFELEFSALHLLFLMSLFFLFAGMTSFILMTNNLLDQDRRPEMVLVIAAATAFVSGILSFLNSNLSTEENLTSLLQVAGKVSKFVIPFIMK